MSDVKNSETEQPKRVYTKLKFAKSDKTEAFVSFVSQNPKTGRICGVRQDSPYPKKICILDKKLMCEVLLNVLYDVALIPMTEKSGYVVIEAIPVEFKATIETIYVPKAVYEVTVKFGNRSIRFDPKDGRNSTMNTIDGVLGVLSKRVDIQNLMQVVDDFTEAATNILQKYSDDGFFIKKG